MEAGPVLLRDLPLTDRYFWKDSIESQLAQTVVDKDWNSNKRILPGNEVTAMALNELAASRGRGFFFYMLTREAWKTWPNENLYPADRRPTAPWYQTPTF